MPLTECSDHCQELRMLKGFTKYPSKPAERKRWRSSSMAKAVRAITGILLSQDQP